MQVIEGSGAVPPEQPPEQEIDVRALWLVLWRRRWLALGVLLAVLVVGTIVTMRAPRIYRATSSVLIQTRAPNVLNGVREVYDLGASGWGAETEQYLNTQGILITGEEVADRVVVDLGLGAAALAEPLRAAGSESRQALVAADPLHDLPEGLRWRLELFGFQELDSRQEILESLEHFEAAPFVQAMVSVNPVRDTFVHQISVDNTSPRAAMTLANAVADAYIAANLAQKVDTTAAAVVWLSDQRDLLQEQFEAAGEAVLEFKRDNNLLSVSLADRRNMLASTLAQMNGALASQRVKRLELESRKERLAEGRPAVDTLQLVGESKHIQTLRSDHTRLRQLETELAARYTAEHPKRAVVGEQLQVVVAAIEAELDRVEEGVHAAHEEAVATEARLRGAIDELKAEALDLNTKEAEFNALTRHRDSTEATYDLVLNRLRESRLSNVLTANNVRRVARARVPRHPIRPRVRLNMLVILMLGLMLAAATVFGVEYLDDTIRSPEQLEQKVGVAFLGVVPLVKDAYEGASDAEFGHRLFVALSPQSIATECCRAIRTNLLFMSPEEPCRSIVVSSSQPLEGKTTVTASLGFVMAQSGLRTLVVEADMRHPRLQRIFGMSAEHGLSNLILGHTDVDSAIIPTGFDNLDVLPAGPVPPSPAELLHTERFDALLKKLLLTYDRILFDSPPLGAVTDAAILGSKVDGALLVFEERSVSVPAAIQAHRQLRDIGVRVLGGVINKVDLNKNRYYYRNYAGGYEYEPAEDQGSVTGLRAG